MAESNILHMPSFLKRRRSCLEMSDFTNNNDTNSVKLRSDNIVRIFTRVNELKKEDILCDITLRCGSYEVRAHSIILAAVSEYFRACLQNAMKESSSGIIELPEMPQSCIDAIIDFAYTGWTTLNDENVNEILQAANQIEIIGLVNLCSEYLLQRLNNENCWDILILSVVQHCYDLKSQVENYIFRFFEAIFKSSGFAKLSYDEVKYFLQSDSLSISSEGVVIDAIVFWVSSDSNERGKYVHDLLKNTVRIPLLSPHYLADIFPVSGIIELFPNVKDFLLEAYQWHCSSLKKDTSSSFRSKAVHQFIYAIGGDNGQNVREPFNCLIRFNHQLHKWDYLESMREQRSVCAAAILNSQLYVIGGYDGSRSLGTVEIYDPQTNKWGVAPSLSRRRASCTCAVLNDILFVIGGVCGPVALKEVEKYDPEAQRWVLSADMQSRRSGCSAATLNGKIYVAGGVSQELGVTNSVEAYDSETDTWTMQTPMLQPRRSFGFVVLDGKLFACGGYDGHSALLTVECYCPITKTWMMKAPMNYERLYCNCVVLHGKIYAAGGMGSSPWKSVEVYDPTTNTWEHAPSLPQELCGFGFVSMEN